ncbi:hypothetical protein [Solimicrobium silvestre]|uniref:NHL repeat n=1 Tax=Solimicrobium silvestre TaxID=2099400 RepID=A0A2S9GSZ6_9BURK|nr:hypothetical protein [Solimicrobium silvestre]PRC90839.1 NHL repeat [Solimicrobium silvestre]
MSAKLIQLSKFFVISFLTIAIGVHASASSWGDENSTSTIQINSLNVNEDNSAIANPKPDSTTNGMLSLIAGNSNGPGFADGSLNDAQFGYATYGMVEIFKGIASDSHGNLYVADTSNHTIRKIDAKGIVTTLAGQVRNPGNEDGPGAQARFNLPTGITIDTHGNLYVTDAGNFTIRKITPAGVVSTLAGQVGVQGYTDGEGMSAKFRLPKGIAVNKSGDIFVVDTGNSTIRKISSDGIVSTFAGINRKFGFVNGDGINALFASPIDITIDRYGVMYVTDSGNKAIRRITPNGTVSTLTGTYTTSEDNDGTLSTAHFSYPQGIGVDHEGNLYISDSHRIRKVSINGYVTTLAGQDAGGSNDGKGTLASFSIPGGITVSRDGSLYVADNFLVRKVNATGLVTTYAGQKIISGSEDGIADHASFNTPNQMAVDKAGNVYVIDRGNALVRKIESNGKTTTLVSYRHSDWPVIKNLPKATFSSIAGLDIDHSYLAGIAVDQSNNVYISDAGNFVILKISSNGQVTVMAGIAGQRGSNDGAAMDAHFTQPANMVFDKLGNLFVVDAGSIRKIDQSGKVATFVGNINNRGDRIDETGQAAQFARIDGITIDQGGNLYVIDNHTLREISSQGVVSTFDDLSEKNSFFNGFQTTNFPASLAIDGDENIFYAIGTVVKRRSKEGQLSEVAGGEVSYEVKPGLHRVLEDISCVVMIDSKTFAILSGNAVFKLYLQ